jgi:hypothetical protein
MPMVLVSSICMTSLSRCMAINYPFYEISAGKRAGVHQFLFLTLEEYECLGLEKAREIEYGRIRSHRISADSEAKRRLSERRKHRRNTEPGLRAREVEMERSRRRERMTAQEE